MCNDKIQTSSSKNTFKFSERKNTILKQNKNIMLFQSQNLSNFQYIDLGLGHYLPLQDSMT